ncbi:dedicator of cytokinesis protein 3 isoform X2 [Cimex lectularius]|uniref:Dedicator of cytokinesis protein 3 n=1 Tax=Cimex lectularius TaxID=79782 RepID=A0A8I6S6W2_CIMLE|nr:dedicator of cytokinesis protein 3 isoform X2 [Cimex lectularius]
MWTPSKNKRYGIAIYNWKGEVRFGLPLEIGDTLQIFEECEGWYRGYCMRNRSIKGIFPASYIHIKPHKTDDVSCCEPVTPAEDPVIHEVTQVLREWNTIWKNLFVARENYKFTTLRKVMRELVDWRRELLTGTLTHDQMREMRLNVTSKIDWGNRKLGLDLVPRCGSDMVDPSTVSVIELHQVHVESSESSIGPSSRGTLKRRGENSKALSHHLYLCMRDFGHNVGETTEVYLSLYDAKKAAYISERFLVKISKDGFSNYIEKLNSNCTIFTDLGSSDLTKELYIVAYVYRIGKMLASESAKAKILSGGKESSFGGVSVGGSTGSFKRPHAVAVLNIGDAVTGSNAEEREFSFKAYQTEDKDFHQLHEFIIRKQTNKYSPLSGQPNYGIVISLRVLHGELAQVREENPLLLKNITLTKKLGFPDVIMPGDVRNDLYITLERGEFERGGKSTGKNIEVSLMVLDAHGNPIDDCVWGASGTEGSHMYRSAIMYHQNSPIWSETITLAVPIEKYQAAHLRLEYRHCSTRDKADNKKIIGFSFARLMEPSGATLQDGIHELLVYRCDDTAKMKPHLYLMMTSSFKDFTCNGQVHYAASHKESVVIKSLLCSTKLTQNSDLLALLQWKAKPERIQEALTRALHLDGEELVKFLQDVLDALFAMFSTEDGNSTQYSGLVFHVLVSILSLLNDNKFQHFKPVVDAYVKNHFAAALVYKGLLSSVQHCADWVGAVEKQEPILKCFRSLESIFKFIVVSRILFARATNGQYEESFNRDLYGVVERLNAVLASSNPNIVSTQVGLIESLSGTYDQICCVLPPVEVARLVATSLDTLGSNRPQLLKAKLVAMLALVEGKLFQNNESRSILLNTICKHIRLHLARREELRLIPDILGKIINFLYKLQRVDDEGGKVDNCLHHDIEVVCINMLDILVQTVIIIIDRSTPVLGSLVGCLIGLLQLMKQPHFKCLSSIEPKRFKELLLHLLLVLRDLLKQDVFPEDWSVVRLATNSVLLNTMGNISTVMFKSLGSFDVQVWSNYFNLAVAFLTQPSLQVEKFSEVKRENILSKYGDMRVKMGFQIIDVWSNLGEHKINFIPSMVGPFLEITLVPEPELRKATLGIFFDMIQCEYKVQGNFKKVESELIEKLDILISENKGDDEYRQLFNTILLERVQNEEPAWKETGWVFVTSVTRLLERLLDYRSVIHGDENRDKRMSCTYNLLNFYKNEINRTEMYVRYIYKLESLHISAQSYAEAGFTLLLYADCLSWENNHMKKLELYHLILSYFGMAKIWEKGIPLLKELAYIYEERLFDYDALGKVLRTQAKFFDNILHQPRQEPEYFRVGFYGTSFPMFVRNKVFIYRGLEYERMEAFTQRIQTEFPAAQIYSKNTPPPHAILQSDTQYIQICNVKPLSDGRLPYRREALCEVPEKITKFYQVNDVCKFQLDRPIHKPQIDKENEFKTLWVERTVLKTAHSLPGVLRWFEVVETSTEQVPPIRYAVETVHSVNRDLAGLIAQYTTEPMRHTNPLSMRLQGVIDANVMGGVAKYQEAFFSPDFIRANPEWSQYVCKLDNLLHEQLEILQSGLVIHGQLAPSDMQPLHQRLQERLVQLAENLNQPIDISSICPKESKHHEEYSNCTVYSHMAEDAYSQPTEVNEMIDTNEPPFVPRPKSYSVNELDGPRRHQRSHSRTIAVQSSNDEAPPLPPRGFTPDKRNSSAEVPPAPPKRLIHNRKENEWNDDNTRDSGYSDASQVLNNLSVSYEDWQIPNSSPSRENQPPPVPPKASVNMDDIVLNIIRDSPKQNGDASPKENQ